MKLYICPNYCHIKNAGERGRCPTCNEWLLEAGNDTEEMRQRLQKDAADRQIAYKDKFRNHKIV